MPRERRAKHQPNPPAAYVGLNRLLGGLFALLLITLVNRSDAHLKSVVYVFLFQPYDSVDTKPHIQCMPR
ncbi:MAG: hypothetical protein JWN70_787 [Planctomycetaceae bacterium]|nr:hypothetical protein [Planctomycetaceae bacterium]